MGAREYASPPPLPKTTLPDRRGPCGHLEPADRPRAAVESHHHAAIETAPLEVPGGAPGHGDL
eukprot:2826879-Lingulodinium_polyedra.AAC.1